MGKRDKTEKTIVTRSMLSQMRGDEAQILEQNKKLEKHDYVEEEDRIDLCQIESAAKLEGVGS